MTRQDELERIKRGVLILDLLDELGVTYVIRGNRARFRSLVNEDQDPSCFVFLDKNDFYDFSAHVGGSVIDFYMYAFKTDYVTAVRELRSRLYNPTHRRHRPAAANSGANSGRSVKEEFEELMSLVMALPNVERARLLGQLRAVIRRLKREAFGEPPPNPASPA